MNKSQFGFKTGTTCDAHYENSTFSRIPCSSNLLMILHILCVFHMVQDVPFWILILSHLHVIVLVDLPSFPTTVLSNKFMYFWGISEYSLELNLNIFYQGNLNLEIKSLPNKEGHFHLLLWLLPLSFVHLSELPWVFLINT